MMKQNFIAFALICSSVVFSQVREQIYLWPDKVPGQTETKKEPAVNDDPVGGARITEVTNPSIIVYEPEACIRNGAAVLVCPGGGYTILAIEKEGYEIASWLNRMGYTAFVLQYRIPQKQAGALMDAQRAMRLIRSNAGKWHLNPDKLGIMGFSAGGSLSARTSTLYGNNDYEPVDVADRLSCKPDFAILIYPAYLDQGENNSLTTELKVDKNTPPMFIFDTADDKHWRSSVVMATALREAGVPIELHLLPTGGHGYGLRKGNVAAETWPGLAEQWIKGVLKN